MLSDTSRLTNLYDNPRATALWKALLPLRSCVSFMNTGAHPDDETTPMLTALALRDGVKISQACANRGEGGQNTIGPEISKDLGALRTLEMERAAAAINMTHYWLSQSPDDKIFDFGFSKSGKETLDKWGETRTLERFVQIIREERPDIICPTFLDISGQHGHHQAMTRSAFKAVEMAANPESFPDQNLDVWQVKKLYLPAWSGAGDAYDDDVPPPAETTRVDATGSDMVLGADYAQIAQYSRSFHKTQGMGNWIEPGTPSIWPLHLAWVSQGETRAEASVFDGLPKTLSDLADFAGDPGLREHLTGAQTAMDAALAAWPDDGQIRKYALAALRHIGVACDICAVSAQSEVVHRLGDKQRQLATVLGLVNDFRGRVTLSRYEARAGDTITVQVFTNPASPKTEPVIGLPEGWSAGPWSGNTCEVHIPPGATPSDPYPDTWRSGQANDPLHITLRWQEDGHPLSISLDPEQRLLILPSYSVDLSPNAAIMNVSNPAEIHGSISRVFPKGSVVSIASRTGMAVAASGEKFTVTPQSGLEEGLYELPVHLDNDPALRVHQIEHPHIGRVVRCEPARLLIRVMDVTLPSGRIAYIGGGNDRTDFWLRKLGIDLTSLTQADVETTDFSSFDAILIGIFAFRTCETLQNRLSDLHDWVSAGGNLVTLYHRPWDNWNPNETPPANLQIGKPSLRWRVTDETAQVTCLEPDHHLLNTPNKITERDWQGWVKERGLYFASEWDEAYQPLLSMADPQEQPLRGALLSARIGRGRHTHTSLILHHQLENLVPGAYRLLANFLHSPKK